MRVENYSEKYFLDVVELVENFHEEALNEYEGSCSPKAIVATIKSSNPNDAFLLIINGHCEGMIFGKRSYSATSGEQIYQEVIWYVNKPHRSKGIRLLRATENSLRSKGVSIIIMVALENSKTEKLKSYYVKRGYKLMESHYVRKF